MDGRIGEIRRAQIKNLQLTQILATQQICFCILRPFRDAVGSSATFSKSSKETYQMDPANSDEAIHEVEHDLKEVQTWLWLNLGCHISISLEDKNRIKCPFATKTENTL